MEYFLSKLNDREFESLGGDIISKYLNLNVEKFKAGKDGGVDGRFWINNKEGIIQCKHYCKTGYSGLISVLKGTEVGKVHKLKPKKYIFITSIPLSRDNKKEISNIFSPYIKSEKDVWGENDINDFLSKKENQDIVEKNYKLWITSTQVLDILYNNAIKGRSECTLKEIESHNQKYVITENHVKGLEILKNKNVIIITGDPGIGKTTLANNLALYYIANGFEFCDIEESISEAESLFREKEKKKIIFYCDDFLGSNMYDAISNKRDSHIVNFINRVKSDKSKRFILTSRTNILTKAISLSHQFQNKQIRNDEFLLQISNLTAIDKAFILYNHIYHSNIKDSYVEEIYKGKRYKEIVKHKNFNPRIIEHITDNNRITAIDSTQYWDYIIEKLNFPEDIWNDFFQNQIDDSVRVLTLLTVFNGSLIDEDELRRSYSSYKRNFNVISKDNTDNSFNAIRRLASQSLLNRNQSYKEVFYYSLFNPSIGDYVLKTYIEDIDLVICLLQSLGSLSSLNFISSLNINKKISKKDIQEIQIKLLNYFGEEKLENKEWDYLLLLCNLDLENKQTKRFLKKIIEKISNEIDSGGGRLYELLKILLKLKEDDSIELNSYSFLTNFIQGRAIDDIDIEYLLKLITEFNIKEEDPIIEIIEDAVNNFLLDEVDKDTGSIDVDRYFIYNREEGDVDYDYSGIKSELDLLIDSIISKYEFINNSKLNIDYDYIISNIDKDKIFENYLESICDYDEDYRGEGTSYSDSDYNIEAIFER